MVQPEAVALLGAAFWTGAALATGIPHRRFPSEFPLLFAVIAVIGSMIGVTELLPEHIDILFTILAVSLYAATPVVFVYHLFGVYPPKNGQALRKRLNQDD